MKRVGWTCVFVSAAIAVAATSAAAAIEFDACGGVVPPGKKGVLTADVVCENRCTGDPATICDPNDEAACEGFGSCQPDLFVLGAGSRLDLNGHLIAFAYQATAVRCESPGGGTCTVVGPGSITGGKGTGITGIDMDVRARNLVVDNTDAAISTNGRLIVQDAVVGGREDKLHGGAGVKLKKVRVGPAGVSSDGPVLLNDVLIDRHGGSVVAGGKVRGRRITIEGFTDISGSDVVLRGVESLPDSSSGSPPNSGVLAEGRVRLIDSDVVRIVSGKRPRLVRSTCQESSMPGGGTWGVCAND